MDKVWIFRSLCNRRRHIAIHPVCQSCTKSEWLGMYCEKSNWNWLWKKTLNCLLQIHTNLKLFLKKIVWYGHWKCCSYRQYNLKSQLLWISTSRFVIFKSFKPFYFPFHLSYIQYNEGSKMLACFVTINGSFSIYFGQKKRAPLV